MMICEGLIPPTENHVKYLYNYLEAQKAGDTSHISQ
jgi:hypothetical protein